MFGNAGPSGELGSRRRRPSSARGAVPARFIFTILCPAARAPIEQGVSCPSSLVNKNLLLREAVRPPCPSRSFTVSLRRAGDESTGVGVQGHRGLTNPVDGARVVELGRVELDEAPLPGVVLLEQAGEPIP